MLAGQLSEKPRHDGVLAFNDFMTAFAKLPAEQREALVLVGASGFSYEEAAETTGVAVGTVREPRQSRADTTGRVAADGRRREFRSDGQGDTDGDQRRLLDASLRHLR